MVDVHVIQAQGSNPAQPRIIKGSGADVCPSWEGLDWQWEMNPSWQEIQTLLASLRPYTEANYNYISLVVVPLDGLTIESTSVQIIDVSSVHHYWLLYTYECVAVHCQIYFFGPIS